MSKAPKQGAAGLWGGHFEGTQAELMEEINASVDFDKRLYAEDIAGSKAHCAMLVKCAILSPEDGDAIARGLDQIGGEIENGTFRFDRTLEDIHLNIESRLTEIAGDAGRRLHTARSRNDQVATDLRLWVRGAIDGLDDHLKALQAALIARAEEHAAAVMPGFTHLQPAQPVTFGHHLLAYVEMLGRDRGRLADARGRLNESPLGAAALAGTAFPIDRRMTAEALGFTRPMANSIDAVSDRDFVIETLAAGSLLATHLSRLAEEIVVWSSAGFAFVKLSDAYTTGSSIMPQKRNPDAAELVRGKCGRVVGALVSLLVTMKGLGLAYSKDMQEDKQPLFDAMDTLAIVVRAMAGMVGDMAVDAAKMRAMAGVGYSNATDLADWLVRAAGVPFREAHGITGRLVRLAETRQCALEDLSLDDMRAVDARITEDVFAVLGLEQSVASRASEGGTAPERVREAAAEARRRFL